MVRSQSSALPAQPERSRRHSRKVAAASFVGTAIEWYDFFLFGTASALVFNHLFFPDSDPFVASLASFATFAVGFIARPFGAVIFGHMGDRIGRKSMLVITLVIMGVGTMLIGVLPTYAMAGVWAPILLVTLRIIQGFAVGGEWGGAVAIAVEHAPRRKRGLYGSWPQVGSPIGLLLSTGVFALVSLMPEESFMSWGWRIPFLLSAGLVVVGMFIRLSITETASFELARSETKSTPTPIPLLDIVKNYKGSVLRAMGLRLSETATYYAVSVFALSYAVETLDMSRTTVLTAIMISSALTVISLPGFGYLSDRIGRRGVYLLGAVGSIPMIWAFFGLMQTATLAGVILAYVLVINTTRDMQYGPQAALFCELFDARVRVSGASIGSQLGGVIGGGITPLVSTALLKFAGIGAVAGYISILCLVCSAAAYSVPKNVEKQFDAEQDAAELLAADDEQAGKPNLAANTAQDARER
ncbi:MFS transporter [Saccharopolyspora tripterygii]